MTTPTPDPLADPVTLAAYETLSGAQTRSTFVICPECGDYVPHDYVPVLAHAESCQPLRAVAGGRMTPPTRALVARVRDALDVSIAHDGDTVCDDSGTPFGVGSIGDVPFITVADLRGLLALVETREGDAARLDWFNRVRPCVTRVKELGAAQWDFSVEPDGVNGYEHADIRLAIDAARTGGSDVR